MATTPANLMQTAVNGAVTLASAYVTAGLVSSIEEAQAAFNAERESIFATLSSQDNTQAPAAVRSVGGGAGGAKATGGGKQFTAEEARAIDLIFGKFKGVTLGELEGMDAAATEEYGYEKGGLAYLKYLANNEDPKGSFIRKAAMAILEDRRAQAA